MAFNSLRSTLLWILIPAVVLTSGLSLLTSRIELQDQVNAAFDRALAGALQSIEVNVSTETGGLAMEQPFYMLEYLQHATDSQVYFRVATEDGLSEIGYTELPMPENVRLEDGEPVFYNATYFGETVRLAAMALPPSERRANPLGSRIILQVGESTAGRDDFMHSVMLQWLRKDAAILVLFILLVFAATILALRPLRDMSLQIRQRTAGNLQPINEATLPREVRPLVEAINVHMHRYAAQTAAQRQFLDDTSHQLRTPLSVLLMQVEYAKSLATDDEMKEVLHAIEVRLNNTITLTNQMLALGRVQDAADKMRAGAPLHTVDLCEVARNVVEELIPSALSKRQDLGLEAPSTPVTVQGIDWLIQQALSNMVVNAIKYCPNQAKITVAVYRDGNHVVLQVEDDGPGMSQKDIALAGRRFRRGAAGRQQHSAGLGLAITQTIADINNAELKLVPGNTGRGLVASLTFKA